MLTANGRLRGPSSSAASLAFQLPRDVIDPRIDVGAQYALLRMFRGDPSARADAGGMLGAVKGGGLAGIYGDDLRAAAALASRLGTVRWKLVPKGDDAALVLDPTSPFASPPTIVFRGDTPNIRSIPLRLDPALRRAWAAFKDEFIPQRVEHERERTSAYEGAIRRLEPFVTKMSGLIRFTLPARDERDVATQLGIEYPIVASLLNALRQTNRLLQSGQLDISQVRTRTSSLPAFYAATTTGSPACPGRSGFELTWFGARLWLDECKTSALIVALQKGGVSVVTAGTAICALVTTPLNPSCVLITVAGGLVGLDGVLLEVIDNWGGKRGVVVKVAWWGSYWIESQ